MQPGQREHRRNVIGLVRKQRLQQLSRADMIVHLPAHSGQRQTQLTVVTMASKCRLQHC
jgi:hypothetical protein